MMGLSWGFHKKKPKTLRQKMDISFITKCDKTDIKLRSFYVQLVNSQNENFTILSIASFLVGVGLLQVSGNPLKKVLADEPDINAFADEVVSALRHVLVEYVDPLKLEPVSQEFWFEYLFGNHTGRMNLTEGWLRDTSTLHRTGDAALTYLGDAVELTFIAEASEISGSYQLWLKANGEHTGTISFQRSHQLIVVYLVFDVAEPNIGTINGFSLIDGPLDVHTSGLGLVPGLGEITTRITDVFRDIILPDIGKRMENVLMEIGNVNLPQPPTTPAPTTTEVPTTEAPTTTEEPTTEAPVTTEEPTTEAPTTTEEPTTEAPVTTEEPATEAPVTTEEPTTEVPVTTEEPTTEAPVTTEEPTTEAPVTTEEPTTEAPTTTEEPTTEAPVTTEEPTTEVPVTTEEPTTEVPVTTEEPATEVPIAEVN